VLAHTLFPSHIFRRAARFHLRQRGDDLRLRVPAVIHPSFPLPPPRSYSDPDGFWGQVKHTHFFAFTPIHNCTKQTAMVSATE
jgi:hypothetical protein